MNTPSVTMETALNIATFVFLGTLLFGALLLGYGLWGWAVWRRYHIAAPTLERLPTRALDEARRGLERLRGQYFRASGEARARLGLEVQRLEMRIQHLQHRTNEEQYTYYQLCRRREKSWREWKRLFDHVGTLHRHERKATRVRLQDAIKHYRELNRMVQDEWHRAVALDDLNLQELHTQGVLPDEKAATREKLEAAPESPAEAPASPVAAQEPHDREPPEPEPAAVTPPRAPSPAPMADDATSPPFGVRPTAVMHQPDFAAPDLPKAGLRYADPEFSMAGIPGAVLADANLSGASFAGVRLVGTQVFRHCNLTGVDFRAIQLGRAELPHQFVDCDITGASFAQAQIEFALFLRCDLSHTLWQNARLNRVKFAECRIAGSNWTGVDLSRTIMSPGLIEQADFSVALQPPHVAAPSPYDGAHRPSAGPRPTEQLAQAATAQPAPPAPGETAQPSAPPEAEGKG